MTTPVTIPRELPKDSALSYDFLREEGIQLIQQMAGATWTDHNTHDPGITILEQLCYAITDLAYRIDYDMKDLLAGDGADSYEDLYNPADILTVNPVTLLDLRKLVIDTEGVKNAWVEKVPATFSDDSTDPENADALVPKGLYRVIIEKDEWSQPQNPLLAAVKAKLQEYRGVCEDFEEVLLLDPQHIRLQGTIEVADKIDDINQLAADILYRISTHLSPRVSFHTLQELLAQGKRTDEIFDGPKLDHGFIDSEELLRYPRKHEIHTSDVIREIMDQKGVLAIEGLSIASGSDIKNWLLSLDSAKTPKLDVKKTLDNLEFTSRGLKAGIDKSLVETLYNKKSRASISARPVRAEALNLIPKETRDRKLAHYYSIQNQFPANYGIGTFGITESAPEKRKAQAKQLTSYLTFFEQFLANSFSQLDHFKTLLSFDGKDTRTYRNQSLLDSVSGLEDVLVSTESYLQYLEEGEADSIAGFKRKNKFLNHLLARFVEKFTGYGMLLNNASNSDYEVEKKLITDKSNFLRDYPLVSRDRAKAYNYKKEDYWESDNISGLEKRIARKLGVENYTRRNLGDGNTEGFHMIEHILLRPHSKETYPFKAHYVPGEITAFEISQNPDHTRCISAGHALKEGEKIRIQGPEQYEGIHTVHATGEGHFEIETTFQTTTETATWQRTEADIRYLVLTEPISTFSAATNAENTFCEVKKHNLQKGDRIEIAGTQHYNGVHTITEVAENGFEVDTHFVEEETTGRWTQAARLTDPYSLQLTFAIPNWMERYQNNELKKFVENTIREETPAHLTVYIKWFSQPEMQAFDSAFQGFLAGANKR